MPKYSVGIQAVVRKSYNVRAPDEDKAIELAHQLFTVAPDGDEHYDQGTTFIEEEHGDVPLDAQWEEDEEAPDA